MLSFLGKGLALDKVLKEILALLYLPFCATFLL